jgi:hypothetical protein
MLHSPAKPTALLLAVASLLAALSGCLGNGLPWGQLTASMAVSFSPSEGRLDPQGRLKTTANYAVDIDQITIGFDALSVVLAAQGAANFDPANPPEGYSLCHNGHCHSDRGALVDYEDIALEMAAGSGGARVTVALDPERKVLTPTPVEIGITPCDPSPCEIPLGELAGLEVKVATLTISGTAYDTLTGDAARLTDEGYTFDVTVPVTTTLTTQLEGSVGPGESVRLNLAATFEFPSAVFDDIDFGVSPPSDDQSWQQVLSAALTDHAKLTPNLTRPLD